MKKHIICSLLLLIHMAAFAQSIAQQTSGNPEVTHYSSWTDHVALAITALSISALLFYLVYLFIGRKKRK